MKMKTKPVFVVTHISDCLTESVEVVLGRRDQFKKWLTYHNITRLEDNIDDHLREHLESARKMFINGHNEQSYAEYGIDKLGLESELADELAEEVFLKTEAEGEFLIKKQQLLTAIKI